MYFIAKTLPFPTQLSNIKHRLKHSIPASNIRAAGRQLIKRAELITHKITQLIDFSRKRVCSFKKIVLRNFYREYFSIFGGDFAPNSGEKCGVACNCSDHSQFNAQPQYLSRFGW